MDQGEFPSTGVSRPPTSPTAPPKPAPKLSGTAIASLICGITGSVLFFTAIVGVILGIVSLKQIKRSNGEKSGKGIAIAGIVVSSASLVLILFIAILFAGLMLPALGAAREAARDLKTISLAKEEGVQVHLYEQDYGTLPPADDWLLTLYSVDPRDFDEQMANLAMNSALSEVRLDDIENPSATVLFVEVAPGDKTISGGPELLNQAPHHNDGYLIVFADGSARYVSEDELDSLVWEP